ncbi:MAG: hypothetical protein G01um101472_203 [Parcubacteria group bacterium Gr01-1014_72]|nr:MAG: hypothetical protein G01um101472_203 [Parcubacteria group bacterium Gr01-1014_72]
MILDVVKVFVPAVLAFAIGILVTPAWTSFLYQNRLWKKSVRTKTPDGREAVIFKGLHEAREIGVPRMGGVIIWVAAGATILLLFALAKMFPHAITAKLDFLSRDQTWLPLATLFLGGAIGLIDDIFDIRGIKSHIAGGLSLKKRLWIVGVLGLLAALWFYVKLDVTGVSVPFAGELFLGPLFIPLFILVMMAIYAGGIIDGIDGLAGGIFATIFTAYGVVAFTQGQINLAAFSASVAGATLAFLWFNIPPARFYMSETGTMALTMTLALIVFMTDSLGEGHGLFALPVIALPLVLTVASAIIQLLSKKFRDGKKVFLVAPLHHHFEAVGWPAYKVTMRYWVFGVIAAIIGTVLALVG